MSVVAVAAAVLASTVAVPSALASSASSFVSLVNSARSSAGLRPYTDQGDLTAVAQGQANRMASTQKLFHNPNLASQVTNWRWVGENVGYGPDVTTLMNAFMASPEHKANILDHDFTQIGVGATVVNGTLWVSMVFRDPMSSGSSPTPTPTSHSTGHSSATHTWVPGHPARAKATAKATAHTLTARVLPAGVVCSATPTAAARVRDLTGLTAADHTVRLVEQGQLMLRGFQCGRALPMTGVFDAATLKALAQA
jgi:Cysteine-rich secretory protein family